MTTTIDKFRAQFISTTSSIKDKCGKYANSTSDTLVTKEIAFTYAKFFHGVAVLHLLSSYKGSRNDDTFDTSDGVDAMVDLGTSGRAQYVPSVHSRQSNSPDSTIEVVEQQARGTLRTNKNEDNSQRSHSRSTSASGSVSRQSAHVTRKLQATDINK